MPVLVLVLVSIWILATPAAAVDWSVPEQQLARKIVAVTGSGPMALQFENRSSIGRRDSEIIENGLHSTLETMGVRFSEAEHASSSVTITLSENLTSYVWVAQITKPGAETAVAMVSIPRPAWTGSALDSVPLSLRKTLLWSQVSPILDVAVLEENATPTRIAVLDPEKISVYRSQNGRWLEEQSAGIVHANSWPRDLRGRLVAARDHLEAYLPGIVCHSGGSLNLSCNETDDPWPLLAAGLSGNAPVFASVGSSGVASSGIAPEQAFFSSARNFFNGTLTPAIRNVSPGKFYSAAAIAHDKSVLWLFAGVDGQVHFFDGGPERIVHLSWGSDVTSVRTSCGAGWQVLADRAGDDVSDSLRAYEFPDRDPVAVSAPVDFPGPISALWTEARGDTTVAVAKNTETGSYEAYRVAVACNQ
ncbi:MAG TPA: hypothetical protein VGS78_13450 [Candidatus Sulfotelmatobacter sp.]|nr:hypothetical protein [Candidatus Sulfotelmatobacter sp.]